MTAKAKQGLLTALLVALLSVITLPAFGAVWRSKVGRSEFEVYAQRTEDELQAIRETQKDILCYQQPRHWRCS